VTVSIKAPVVPKLDAVGKHYLSQYAKRIPCAWIWTLAGAKIPLFQRLLCRSRGQPSGKERMPFLPALQAGSCTTDLMKL